MMDRMSQELAAYLVEQVNRRGWSGREFGRHANISTYTASRILRGEGTPTPETLRRIAETLGIDETYLLRLAGHLEETPRGLRNAAVIALAQRIEDLPEGVREAALEALGAVLDSIYRVSVPRSAREAQEGLEPALIAEIEEAVQRGDEESMFTLAVDLLAKYRPDILKAAAAELLARREREQRQSPPVADQPHPD